MLTVATVIVGYALAPVLLMAAVVGGILGSAAFLYALSFTVSAVAWVFGVRLHQRPQDGPQKAATGWAGSACGNRKGAPTGRP